MTDVIVDVLTLRPEIGFPEQGRSGVHYLRWTDSTGAVVAQTRFGSTEFDAFMDLVISEGWFHEWFEQKLMFSKRFPSWMEEIVQMCADEGLVGEPLWDEDDDEDAPADADTSDSPGPAPHSTPEGSGR